MKNAPRQPVTHNFSMIYFGYPPQLRRTSIDILRGNFTCEKETEDAFFTCCPEEEEGFASADMLAGPLRVRSRLLMARGL